VNVSALQINEGFGGVVERILKQTGFPPQQLELEITESALIGDTEVIIAFLESRWMTSGLVIRASVICPGCRLIG
jgi:EAL domain-containing protein (putative c-di-GMP-specific phosphodiesterase class I)